MTKLAAGVPTASLIFVEGVFFKKNFIEKSAIELAKFFKIYNSKR